MKRLLFLFFILLSACTTASYDYDTAKTQTESLLEIQLPDSVANTYFLQEPGFVSNIQTWMRFDIQAEDAHELFTMLGFPNLPEAYNPELTGIFAEPEGENTEWWYEWHNIEGLITEQRHETPYLFQIKVDTTQTDVWIIYYLRANLET